MSPPGPPPPPAPSCAHRGTVQGGIWIPNNPDIMYYDQPHTHETNGPHKCSYRKDRMKLGNLKSTPGGGKYTAMVNRLCGYTENLAFELPGADGMCAEQGAAVAIAKAYCGTGDNIISQTSVCNAAILPGKEGTYRALLETYCKANNVHIKNSGHACSTIKTYKSTLYNTISEAFCEANPDDSFCSCYNVLKDKCDPTSKTGVAGCSDTSAYVDLRNATPDDFKSVWDGQRKCGSICAGANKYIPPKADMGCKTTIQICAQDITVGSASGSDIKASCELNANEGSSSGGGGGGGGDTEQETITIPRSVEEVRSFLPTSIDDLRTSKKKQVGVTTVGGSSMSMICCVILLIVATTMGAGPVARRFSR